MGGRFVHLWAAFLVRHAVVEHLPHESTETMGDGADRLGVAKLADKAPVEQIEEGALALDGRVGAITATSLPRRLG